MLDAATLADLQELAESAMRDTVQITRLADTLDAGGAPAPTGGPQTTSIKALVYLPKIDIPRSTAIAAGDMVVVAGVTYAVKPIQPLGVYDVVRTIEVVLPAGEA
jgi:hypothetical protein